MGRWNAPDNNVAAGRQGSSEGFDRGGHTQITLKPAVRAAGIFIPKRTLGCQPSVTRDRTGRAERRPSTRAAVHPALAQLVNAP